MTANVQDQTHDQTRAPAPGIDISSTKQVPFGRLVSVELRKMWDTRAGLWLLALTAGLLLLVLGATLLAVALDDNPRLSATQFSQIMTIPLSLLVPVLAITSITSEWSQRTGLVSFALEPHRMRVVWAKFVTVVILALLTIVLAIVFGALGTLMSAAITGGEPVWNIDGSVFAWTIVNQLVSFAMAFGFGLVLLNTPAAIAIFYVVAMLLPLMVYTPLYAFFGWARDVIPWIDLGFAMSPYMAPPEASAETDMTTLMQVFVAFTIWVVLPFAFGLRRVSRTELK